jgi:peptide/nickel transport system permease protein
MTLFIFRRVLQGALVILLMSVVVFVGIYQIGNPVDILINPEAPPHIRQQTIERLGLDQPLPILLDRRHIFAHLGEPDE